MPGILRISMVLGALALTGAAAAESPLSLARQGIEFFEQGRYQESIDAYRKALEKNPDEPLIRYNLGTILATDSRYEDAEQILQEAAGSPNRFSGDAWFNLGVSRSEKALKAHPAVKDYVQNPKPSIEDGLKIDAKAIDQAMAQFKEAQTAYRQSIITGNSGQLSDARYNFEVTQKMINRLEELKKEQQQQQQQQQEQNQQNQKQQNQNPQDQQNQQQNQDQQQQQQQQQNQDQDQQKQQDQQKSDEQKKNEEEQKRQQQKKDESKENQQPAQPQPQPGEGDPKRQEPLTPEQMDAMRLLNLIEDEKPEQFKKLFEFKGRRSRGHSEKDW